MQIEITTFVDDYDIMHYISKSQQSIALSNMFNECYEDSKKEFINFLLENEYFINELKSRGYTITKNE